jgi:hypothetical protein
MRRISTPFLSAPLSERERRIEHFVEILSTQPSLPYLSRPFITGTHSQTPIGAVAIAFLFTSTSRSFARIASSKLQRNKLAYLLALQINDE